MMEFSNVAQVSKFLLLYVIATMKMKGVRSGYMQFVSFFKDDSEIVFIAWGRCCSDQENYLESTMQKHFDVPTPCNKYYF